MLRAFLAEGRIVRRADSRGEPHPSLVVEHRVVHGGLAIPQPFLAPKQRGRINRIFLRAWRLRIAHRHFHLGGRIADGIEDRNHIRAIFGRAVKLAVGVDRRIALIGGDLVMEVSLGVAPIPDADDRRCARPLAGRDGFVAGNSPAAIRSVQSANSGNARSASSRLIWLIMLSPPCPTSMRRIHTLHRGASLAPFLGDDARRLVADLVAAVAAVRFNIVQPFVLRPLARRDAVALRPVPGNSLLSGILSIENQ